MSTTCTAENIKYIFRTSGIGEVKRVDFTSITPRENMVSNYNTNEWQSAFVHIVYMYDTVIAKVIMQNITAGAPYKFWFKPGLFWLILKNTNPIPDTIQNIHQIAENARLLEERVVKQEQQLAKQSAEIDRLQHTVYQIIGHVFDHRTDGAEVFGNVNYMLYGKFYEKGWLFDENDNGHTNKDLEEGEVDEQSISNSSTTYTDMPALVAPGDLDDDQTTCSSDSSSTHGSMPALMTNSELEDDQTTCSESSDSSDSMPELVANFVLVDADDDDETCSL